MKYYKKSTGESVEAIQFTGKNTRKCLDFLGKGNYLSYFKVATVPGTMEIAISDFIIKSQYHNKHHNGLYKCNPDSFLTVYSKEIKGVKK